MGHSADVIRSILHTAWWSFCTSGIYSNIEWIVCRIMCFQLLLFHWNESEVYSIDTSDLNAAVVKCVDNQLFQIKYSIMVGEVFKGRYRMYLLNVTLTSENTSTCITFVCSDGVVRKDISWLENYSAKVCEVSDRSCDRCGDWRTSSCWTYSSRNSGG